MLWPWRDARIVPLYLLVFCALVLGIAGARERPAINLYLMDRARPLDGQRTSSVGAGASQADIEEVLLASISAGLSESSAPVADVESLDVSHITGEEFAATPTSDGSPQDSTGAGASLNGRMAGELALAAFDSADLRLGAAGVETSGTIGVDEETSGAENSQPKRCPGPIEVINGYDVTEWQAISGIGPTLACRIVEYRESIGGFESLDELLEVSGIGPAKLSQIEMHLQQLLVW